MYTVFWYIIFCSGETQIHVKLLYKARLKPPVKITNSIDEIPN